MSFKTILVHLDAGARCTARVDLAIGLAAAHGSHLVGLAPTGLPDVLAVMGAYGHSRVREWVLGGTTRHLLDHMTVPTLMSH